MGSINWIGPGVGGGAGLEGAVYNPGFTFNGSTTTSTSTTSSSTTTAVGLTIELAESFDHLALLVGPQKWDPSSASPTSLVAGRVTGQAARFTNNTQVMQYTMSTAGNIWSAAFAFRVSAFGQQTVIAQFLNGTNSQLELLLLANGSLAIACNGVQLAAMNVSIPTNLWQFIEWSVVVNTTLGAIYLRVMEQVVIIHVGTSGSPFNTRGYPSTDLVTTFKFGPQTPGSGVNYDFDDFILSAYTYFPGQIQVQAQIMSGAGPYTQMTPVGQSQNYQCVSNVPPNYDVDYVVGGSAGLQDSYTPNTPVLSNVIAVQQCVLNRRDSSAPRSLAPIVTSSDGVTVAQGPAQACQASYRVARAMWMKNPITNAAWTGAADVAGVRFGQKITA